MRDLWRRMWRIDKVIAILWPLVIAATMRLAATGDPLAYFGLVVTLVIPLHLWRHYMRGS